MHYLVDIFKKNLNKYKLKIVGTGKSLLKKYYSDNINFIGPINNEKNSLKFMTLLKFLSFHLIRRD